MTRTPPPVKISPAARPEFIAAFRSIAERVDASLADAPKHVLPIKMFVAGGAAMHFYAGERVSRDIDAVFSRRVALPDPLDAAYRDSDGAGKLLYLDSQYNDTFRLLHEDAYDDAQPLRLQDFAPLRLAIYLLSPVDLAVSKIARLSEQDRGDIAALARLGMIAAPALRKRAAEALGNFVGNLDRLRLSIDLAVKLVESTAPKIHRAIGAKTGKAIATKTRRPAK